MRWQFAHPSDLPPIGLAIEEGGRLVCFVAAIGQHVRINGEDTQIYVSSHFAAAGAPVLSYVIPQPIGEKLQRFGSSSGWEGKRRGLVPGHVALAKPCAAIAERVTVETWTDATMEIARAADTLELPLHKDALAHYETHPWTREFIVARSGSRATATAVAGTVRTITPNGRETVAVLNAIRAEDASSLEALLAYTGKRFNAKVVSLPVCAHLGAEMLRAIRARRMAADFAWYLSAKAGAPIQAVAHTSLEII